MTDSDSTDDAASTPDTTQTDGMQTDPNGPVLAELKSLHAAFDAKIRYDEVRERFIATMSEELAAHRQGVYQMQLRPVLLDLVVMYDDLTQAIAVDDCTAATAAALGFFRDTVEQVLARNGVERFTVEGDLLDRSRQKVVSVVETADPDLDRQVAARLRPGFFWNGKVLRPEWVSAYRKVAARDPEASPATHPTTVTEVSHQPEGAPS
jgi:molecular chaperone GrpE (heat shock protein)